MMVKAIIFDLDDTLLWDQRSVKEAFAATCEAARDKYDLDPERLEEAVRKEATRLYQSYETYPFTQMIGINPFEGLWGNFLDEDGQFKQLAKVVPAYRKEAWVNGLKELGVDDPDFGEELAERFPEERRKRPFIYEDTFTLLDQLHGHYQLLLLTDGSPDLQMTKLEITPEISPYFDHILISGAFGRGKPDPAIFEHALSLLGVSAEEALMVGDNLMTDILGANQAGIPSVWVNRHGKRAGEVKPVYEIKQLLELNELLTSIE